MLEPMCRWLTYIGPPVRLDRLLLEPDHSLISQSHSPREMRTALMNADGFGVAWYTGESPTPALYRSPMPLWSDLNLPWMAPHIRSGCIVANVRSATPGFDISHANTQPFVHGRWAFTHNGFVHDFRRVMLRPLRRSLSDEAYHAIQGTADSEHLFALLLDIHGASRGEGSLLDALRRCVATLERWLDEADTGALLNIAISDGDRVVAVRHAVRDEAPTLYVRDGHEDGEGTIVASERPWEDARWRAVQPGELVVCRADAPVESHSL